MVALVLTLALAIALAQTPQHRLFMQSNLSRGSSYVYGDFEFAPTTGVGMPSVACSTTAPTGVNVGVPGEAITATRATVAECYSNDGQTLTQLAVDKVRVSSGDITSTWMGVWSEDASQNDILQSRDPSQSQWTKTNMTCVRTATGMRNDANGAGACIATANNATLCQTITTASAPRSSSWHIRRRNGSAAVTLARDASTYSADISASLSTTRWRRVVPKETPGCAGGDCIVVAGLTSSVLNPQVCLKLALSGDSVDIDFVQDEAGVTATSPIATSASAVPRAVDLINFAGKTANPTPGCAKVTLVPQPYASSGLISYLLGFSGQPTFFADSNSNVLTLYDVATFTDAVLNQSAGVTTTYVARWASSNKESYILTDPGGYKSGTFDGTIASATPGIKIGYSSNSARGVVKGVVVDSTRSRCGTVVAWVGDSITRGLFITPLTPPATYRHSSARLSPISASMATAPTTARIATSSRTSLNSPRRSSGVAATTTRTGV
jgi:hypothetical protein